MIPDQIKVWNRKHGDGDHEIIRAVASPLAELSLKYIPEHSKILELGCGVGRDALFFAKNGHSVIATDGSGVVIEQNNKYQYKNVTFDVLDIRDKLPYTSAEFDIVFANLSLHYYEDKVTRAVIKEIAFILKPEGLLVFACKSKDDYRTKGAREVEKNIFVAKNDHAIHLFSAEYVTEILGDRFKTILLDEVDEEYTGKVTSIVRCIAKKSGGEL